MKKPLPYKKLIILTGLAVIIIAGLFVAYKTLWNREVSGLPAAPKKDMIILFLPTDEGGLMRKTVDTKEGLTGREKIDLIMRELRMGNAVPDKLTLKDFSVNDDGVLYLNLSQEFKSEQMDAEDEITTVYAITNSFLANFREARSAQILIEGQAVYTINGVMYTYAPIEFNNQLVEE